MFKKKSLDLDRDVRVEGRGRVYTKVQRKRKPQFKFLSTQLILGRQRGFRTKKPQ